MAMSASAWPLHGSAWRFAPYTAQSAHSGCSEHMQSDQGCCEQYVYAAHLPISVLLCHITWSNFTGFSNPMSDGQVHHTQAATTSW